MMKYYELFGFMSQELANEIIEYAYSEDKALYKATVKSVAEAKKLRPSFYEQKPRKERHKDMVDMLSRPRLEEVAATFLRTWLLKKENAMLVDFLNALGMPHKDGVVDSFPETMADDKLKAGVDLLLSKYPAEKVIVYLQAFFGMNEVRWPNLQTMLESDSRLQLA